MCSVSHLKQFEVAPNTVQITRIKLIQYFLVVQRFLIENKPERPFVKILLFVPISGLTVE